MARITACAVLLACFISQASANIIEVDFSGTAFAIRSAFDSQGYYAPIGGLQPFNATFVFDTDKGTLTDHRLDNGLVSAFIDLDVFGSCGNITGSAFCGSHWNGVGGSFLTWNDDLSSIYAFTGVAGSYFFIGITTVLSDNRYGSFQFGLCPTSIGGPCGTVTDIETMTVTGLPLSTPGPVLGAGIPGLLLTIGGLLVYYRRNRHQP